MQDEMLLKATAKPVVQTAIQNQLCQIEALCSKHNRSVLIAPMENTVCFVCDINIEHVLFLLSRLLCGTIT